MQREYKKHRPWTNENSPSPQLAGFDVGTSVRGDPVPGGPLVRFET